MTCGCRPGVGTGTCDCDPAHWSTAHNHVGTWEAREFKTFAEIPTVFFSPAFLLEPGDGWQVLGGPKGHSMWMARGTLVKMQSPARVWRLTGHADFRTGYLEGCWPD